MGDDQAIAADGEAGRPSLRSVTSGPAGLGALLLGLTLTALWIWWSLDFGAFFPTVLYPGSILLLAVLGLLLPSTPLPIARTGPHVMTMGALLALAIWTLLSAIWSPVPDAAPEDAIRTMLYATVFLAGLWFAASLGRHSALSLGPVILAGGVVVVVTLLQALLTDAAATLLSGDGTLDYPLGYRNANAAFFFIVYWAAAGSASRDSATVPARSACAVVAAGSLALAVMSQSRGSILAATAALAVFVITAGDRRRAALALIATALPVAISVPILIEPFDAVGTSADALPGLHHAAIAAIVASLAAGLLMTVATMLERRLKPRAPARIRPRPRTAALLAGGLLAVALAVTLTGNPKSWVDDRISEFEQNSLPDLTTAQSRFSVSASSTRSDYWRVAISGATDQPLLGEGAGGFEVRYLRDRETQDTPRDAHSAPLEVLGELGVPGLLMFVAALASACLAALRSRRFGADATLLSSVALTAAAYWSIHASIDWFWSYPIPTAIVFSMLGSAAAASSMDPRARATKAFRRTAVAVTVIVSLAIIPLYLAERLTVTGVQSGVNGETADAYRELDAAADLDPLSDTSLLALAELARREGDDGRALQALERAQSRQPDNYLTYLIRARVLAETDPDEAQRQIDAALALNPLNKELRILSERLSERGSAQQSAPGDGI